LRGQTGPKGAAGRRTRGRAFDQRAQSAPPRGLPTAPERAPSTPRSAADGGAGGPPRPHVSSSARGDRGAQPQLPARRSTRAELDRQLARARATQRSLGRQEPTAPVFHPAIDHHVHMCEPLASAGGGAGARAVILARRAARHDPAPRACLRPRAIRANGRATQVE
jgi:hypothetical protein